MERTLLFFVTLYFTAFVASVQPSTSFAQTPSPTTGCTFDSLSPSKLYTEDPDNITITLKTKEPCFTPGKLYVFQIDAPNSIYNNTKYPVSHDIKGDAPVSEITFPLQYAIPSQAVGTWGVEVCTVSGDKLGFQERDCNAGLVLKTEIEIVPPDNVPTLEYNQESGCVVQKDHEISLNATDLTPNTEYELFYTKDFSLDYWSGFFDSNITNYKTGVDEKNHTFTFKPRTVQNNEMVCLDIVGAGTRSYKQNCILFDVTKEDPENAAEKTCSKDNFVNNFELDPTREPPKPPCPTEKAQYEGDQFVGCEALYTGLGVEINTEPAEFISALFRIMLSISGGILLLLIIYSGYQMMTSQGNPERIQAARERITSAIVGFAFLIFSLVILEVIGVDILHIPGFGGTTQRNTPYEQLKSDQLDKNEKQKVDPSDCGTNNKKPCERTFKNNNGCAKGYILEGGSGKCRLLHNPNGPVR